MQTLYDNYHEYNTKIYYLGSGIATKLFLAMPQSPINFQEFKS